MKNDQNAEDHPMKPTYNPPKKLPIALLLMTLITASVVVSFQAIPLALIRVIYLLSVFALPLAFVIRIFLKRFAGLALGLIVFTPLGFYGTMIWESGDEMCHKAARNGSVAWLNTVLKGGPDVVDTHGNSLLMKAAQYGHTEMVRELLQRGAHTGYRDGDGDTALSVAIRYKHPECVKLLRDAGAR
jgi:Ankyrin repeats (3 copies)